MKCNKCPNAATLHITEIVSEDHVEELHLCEVCAHKYLSEPQAKTAGKAAAALAGDDVEVFRDELLQLLENIHGETRHVGKVPRRLPQSKQTQAELMQLRKQLLQ